MAEINSGEIIAKEAIKEVLALRDAFDASAISLKNLVSTSKELGVNIKQAESTKQLRTETTKLTQSQIELQKIEKQIEVANARATKAYQDQQKALQNLRAEQKERIALGQKDAKLVNEQNSSFKQLEAALNKNRVAYKSLADEEARSSKEGKELKAIIDQQDASVKKLNGDLGDFTDNVGNYEGSVKGLKLELKAARDEMAKIAATTGTTSKEFVTASNKAGEIKDKINDLNDALKNSSASKFENIGNSLKDVGSKLINLDFEGAATSAKQFATVVKSLTFAEVVAGIESFGASIATVGKAILTNPLFYIAAIIGGIALAFKHFYDQQEKATQLTIERFKREEEALLSRYEKEIKIQKILGKQTFELEKDKQKIIIETANKELQLIKNQYSFQAALKAGFKEQDILKTYFNDEEIKRIDELTKVKRDAADEIDIITAEQLKYEQTTSKESLKQKKDDLFALNKFRLQVQIESQQELADNEKNSYSDRVKAVQNFTKLKNQLAKLEYNESISQENLTNSALLLIKEEYNNKVLKNKKDASKEELKINEEIVKISRDNAIKINAENIAFVKKQIQADAEAAQEKLNNQKKIIQNEAFARIASGEEQSKVKKETDEKLLALEKSLSDDYIQIQIERVQKILEIEGLSTEESIALKKELYDLKTKLDDSYYNQLEDKSKKSDETEKKRIEGIKNAYQYAYSQIADINNQSANNQLTRIDQELKSFQELQQGKLDAVKRTEEEQTALAGDNQTKKTQIAKQSAAEQNKINNETARREKQLNDEKNRILRRQAIFEKGLALVQASINIEQAATKAYAQGGVFGAVLAGVVVALGAVQLALIAQKPIPQFFKGTDNAPGGLAWVGEQGTELMRKPGGNFELTPSSPTLMDVPRGSQIVPHEQTMRVLAMSALRQNGGSVQEKDSVLVNEVKKLNSNIGNIKQIQASNSNAYVSGLIAYEAKKVGENHIQHQRIISLGKWVK